MAGENTKNLGQVAGVSISANAPTNTLLIWFDTTPTELKHKVWNPNLQQWIPVKNDAFNSITYSELQNAASGAGLTMGQFYIITDKGNAVALVISNTKVQYTDIAGNIVIDDLVTNGGQQYHIPSTNLRMDGLPGTFNSANLFQSFDFDEDLLPDSMVGNEPNYFAFGKKMGTNGLFSLFKYRLANLISNAAENALTWNKGLFFNFNSALRAQEGQSGGTVLYDDWVADRNNQNQALNTLQTNLQQQIDNKTTDVAISGKKIVSLSPATSMTSLATGDTYATAWNKIQGWLNINRYGSGVTLNGYSTPSSYSAPTASDTVNQAIGKLYRMILNGGVGTGTIGTTELADDSVTNVKLAGGITGNKIANLTLTNDKFVAGTILHSSMNRRNFGSLVFASGVLKYSLGTPSTLSEYYPDTAVPSNGFNLSDVLNLSSASFNQEDAPNYVYGFSVALNTSAQMLVKRSAVFGCMYQYDEVISAIPSILGPLYRFSPVIAVNGNFLEVKLFNDVDYWGTSIGNIFIAITIGFQGIPAGLTP